MSKKKTPVVKDNSKGQQQRIIRISLKFRKKIRIVELQVDEKKYIDFWDNASNPNLTAEQKNDNIKVMRAAARYILLKEEKELEAAKEKVFKS